MLFFFAISNPVSLLSSLVSLLSVNNSEAETEVDAGSMDRLSKLFLFWMGDRLREIRSGDVCLEVVLLRPENSAILRGVCFGL